MGNVSNVTWVVAFISTNVLINMFNKWMLSSLEWKTPVFLTVLHQLFTFTVLFASSLTSWWKPAPMEEGMLSKMSIVGVLFAVNVALNNTSLLHLSVSANQIIRSAMPVIVALFALVLERKTTSPLKSFLLLILVVGVVFSVFNNPSADVIGVIEVGISLFCGGCMVSFVGLVLGGKKMDAWSTMYYMAPPAVLVLLPFIFILEEHDVLYSKVGEEPGKWTGMNLLGCVLAFVYNYAHYGLIKYTSSVYSAVVGNFKIAFIIVVDVLVFGTQMQPLNWVGVAIVVVSYIAYSSVGYLSNRRSVPHTEEETKPILDKRP